LGRLKDGTLEKIASDRGLFDDYISQIVSDGNGWLWFGADHGIFKIREEELNVALKNTNSRVQAIHFGRDESLPSLQANFDESPNCWRTRNGKILLPMSSALAIVDPNQMHDNFEPPPVLLARVLVDDTTAATYGGATPAAAGIDLQNPSATLRLPPGHHRLEFDFTAINFSAPENVALQFRLVGSDDHWIAAGAQHSAIYPRLAAGNYRFEIRARNSDGAWSRQNAALAFSVARFFWQTLWFRLAAIILAGVILILLVRYVSFRRLQSRIRSLEQQAAIDRERARIARDIHDHVGGTLTQMTLQLEMALRSGGKTEKIEGHIQKSLSAARRAIQSLDETVWAVNPGNDTLPHLVNYIGEYAVEFLDNAGIRCRLDLPEQLPSLPVSTEVRHNLFLAIKESLNNVVRHANAAEVFLNAQIQNGSLKFSVADNGRGFQPGQNKVSADGLRNMRQRMHDIGGECEIESAGGGTKISFICPWRKGRS
jgi:signal transduction histidine kinase